MSDVVHTTGLQELTWTGTLQMCLQSEKVAQACDTSTLRLRQEDLETEKSPSLHFGLVRATIVIPDPKETNKENERNGSAMGQRFYLSARTLAWYA